jgi:hypothetical protein
MLTYLKKELMEINNWVQPSEVKLLGIDTQVQDVELAQANAGVVGQDRMQSLTNARLGSIHLDGQAEYCQVGAPLFEFIQQVDHSHTIGNGTYSYLDWLDTRRLLELGQNACSTVWGAGAFRQLGRLSFFYSVDKVYDKMKADLKTLKTAMDAAGANTQLEIIIACSTAGGTGAGTLIDTAWLLRKAAQTVNLQNYVLRAFIVLPTAFEPAGPIIDKRLRSYCFWRELDRFMLSSLAVAGNTKIVFNPQANPPLEVTCDRAIFDNTYLVDPDRHPNPLNHLSPEQGVFPAVSHMISFILDNLSGHRFAAHYPNVAIAGGVQLPPGVYHSAFGCYTIKVPVYQARDRQSRELAYAALEKLVQPVLSNTGDATDVRADRNRESAASVQSATRDFLNAGAQGDVQSTPFFSHIETVNTHTAAGADQLLKYAHAEASVLVNRSGETLQKFLNAIPATGEKDYFTAAGGPLQGLRSEHVWHICKRSRDRERISPSANLPDLLACVTSLEDRWFGRKEFREDPDDKRKQVQVRVSDGDKTVALKEASRRQMMVYERILSEWVGTQLNGFNADPIVAKSGKIGFVSGALKGMIVKFTQYTSFLTAVKNDIGQQRVLATRLGAAQAAERKFREWAPKTSFIPFFDDNVDPRARDAEDSYLERIDALYNVYLAEQVITTLEKTIEGLISATEKSIAEIERWVRVLVVGRKEDKDITLNYKGMYNALWETVRQSQNVMQKEIEQGNRDFKANRQFGGVQQIIQAEIASENYQQNDRLGQSLAKPPHFQEYNDAQEIRDILADVKWIVEVAPTGGLTIKCGLMDDQSTANYFANGETTEVVSRNLDAWRRKAQAPFVNINANHRLDMDIASEIPDAAHLADMFKDWIEPMVSRVAAPTGAWDKTAFVRVDDSHNLPYFDAFRARLREIGPGSWENVNPGVPAGQSNSEDPFKMSVVLGHHLMPSSDFRLLEDLEALFIQNIANPAHAANPAQYYNFLAEKNALEFAMKRPHLLSKNYAPFDPMVASLLEDRRKISLFCWAYALGIIKRESAGQNHRYNWLVGEGKTQVHLSEVGMWQNVAPSIFDIIRLWMKGEDCRQNMGTVYRVDFAEIEKAILAAEKASREKTIKKYQDAANETKAGSLAAAIMEDMEVQQGICKALQNERYFEPKRYTDVADLARILLLDRIEAIS